jgi:PAS domain S-box-containing protein
MPKSRSNESVTRGAERPEGTPAESEMRLRALVGSIDEIVFEFDGEGTYLNIWTANEALLVRPRSEFIGCRVTEVMGEELARPYLNAFKRVLAGGQAENLEYPLQIMGEQRWFLSRISLVAASGSDRTICVLARDITERKHGEQRLAAHYAVARVLAESATLDLAMPHLLEAIGGNLEWDWGAFWIGDRQAAIIQCANIWHAPNIEATQLDASSRETTFTPGQGLPGHVWQSAEPAWIADAAKDSRFLRVAAAKEAGLRGAAIFPILLGGEALGVIEFFSRAVRTCDEEQLRTLSIIGSQIGQFILQKRAEEALQRSERRFRALIEHSTDAVFLATDEGTVLYASPSIERVLGYSAEELKGQSGFNLVHSNQIEDARRAFAEAILNPGKVVRTQRLVRHRDGSLRWVDGALSSLLDEPSVRAVVVNLRDITERKRAEEALRQSEQRFRDYAETASDWFWETDSDHRFTRLGGHDSVQGIDLASRVGGKRWEFATDVEEEPEKWRLHIRDLEARRSFRDFAFRTVRDDGSTTYIATSGKPIFDNSGRFLGYRGVSSDVTAAVCAEKAKKALQQAQSELVRITRLTTMGELTASIAHEVVQPLSAVITNCNTCLHWLEDKTLDLGKARSAARRGVQDAERASDIISRIRALMTKSEAQKVKTDMNVIIEEVLALTNRELRDRQITVYLELAENLPPVLGDRVQLQQLVLNLVMNGIEAMTPVSSRPKVLKIETRMEGTKNLLVLVSDSGVGLDPEKTDQIFNAFFTTKPEGIGMGLAICRSIVETHDGRICASQNIPYGAEFQFTLPTSGAS